MGPLSSFFPPRGWSHDAERKESHRCDVGDQSFNLSPAFFLSSFSRAGLKNKIAN